MTWFFPMTYDQLLALALFAFGTSITPGPNNLMLLASGANFGFWRTLPHMLGVGMGFIALIVSIGVGLHNFLTLYPIAHYLLRIASICYLVYLAWKIGTSAPAQNPNASPKPLTFFQAAAFQWINPKGWAMAMTAIAVYAPDTSFAMIVLVALIFGAINVPSVSAWALLGQHIARFLQKPAHLRGFNLGMAALILASLYTVITA